MRIFSIFVLSMLFIWLILSLIAGKNPIQYAEDVFSRDPNITDVQKMNKKELRATIENLSKTKDSLSYALASCQEQIMNRNAVVQVDNDFLNLRSEPSIDASILTKIPNGTTVEVIQIDPKTYFLDNRAGRWVEVYFEDKKGWVWGNYLKL